MHEVAGLRGLDANVPQEHVVDVDLVAVDGRLLGRGLRDLAGTAAGERRGQQYEHADDGDAGAFLEADLEAVHSTPPAGLLIKSTMHSSRKVLPTVDEGYP